MRELAARRIELPVVLMSADDEAEAVALKYRVAAYLKKPIAISRLLEAIAACTEAPVHSGHFRPAA